MKKMLLLSFALLSLSALAQDKPSKSAEVQKLPEQLSVERWFVGDWICEGTEHASPAGPGAKFTDRFRFTMTLRGSWLIYQIDQLRGPVKGKQTLIGSSTWDANAKVHVRRDILFVVSHEKSEFGVEWMRFEADAAVPDLVRQVPHVAFEVADLASELAGPEILIPPNSPSDGVRVAFIVENGAPIELLEFTDPNHPGRRQQSKMLI